MKKDIEQLLNKFYRAISFKEGEEPDFNEFKELFINSTVVIEYDRYNHENFIQKTISQHIEEMINIFNDYPLIKSKGFVETELFNEITICGPLAYVQSKYRKNYFNGTVFIEDIGINCMQIAKCKNEYKIISIGWYEDISSS